MEYTKKVQNVEKWAEKDNPTRESILYLPTLSVQEVGILMELGFTFVNPNNQAHLKAKLPEGWHREKMASPAYQYLLDEKNRKRGFYFYKKENYGTMCQLVFYTRYQVKVVPLQPEEFDSLVKVYVCDGNIINGNDTVCEFGEYATEWDGGVKKAKEQARAFLNRQYPHWESVLAYWS